jgi:alkanesulfonate monooxygenase SsuD/methylene tetrahydromethanopterin reductase-like flavin-dependent oxidoreductase (luciferase family)
MRAAHYGFPMMLAIIGGDPKRFAPYADLFRRALNEMGKPALPLGVHSHGYVAATDDKARQELFDDYKRMRDKIGAERGWAPFGKAEFEREIEHGSLYVGAPETVARKIAETVKALGVDRFDMKYSAGPLGHDKMMKCIELYGRKVMPLVRDMVG